MTSDAPAEAEPQAGEMSRTNRYAERGMRWMEQSAAATPATPAPVPAPAVGEPQLGTNAQGGQSEGDTAGEAYQVIGALAEAAGMFETPEIVKALDYFSAETRDGTILPWTPPRADVAADDFDYSKPHVIDRRGPIEHELKTWAVPYRAVEDGTKTFEFRKLDRDFRNGDTLWLRETEVSGEPYTGRELRKRIGFVLKGGMFGVPLGYCVMSLLPLEDAAADDVEALRGIAEALLRSLKMRVSAPYAAGSLIADAEKLLASTQRKEG